MHLQKSGLLFIIIALLMSCARREEPAGPVLHKIFAKQYKLQHDDLHSLAFIVTGSNQLLREFARRFQLRDSVEVHILWKAPYDLKSTVYTRGKQRRQVELPRWVDFGLAFGLTQGTDAVPLFWSEDFTVRQILDSLNIDENALAAIESGKEDQLDVSLHSKDQALSHIFHTEADFTLLRDEILLSDSTTRENAASKALLKRHWLKLENGTIITRQKEVFWGSRLQNRQITQIMYQKVGNFWLPEWIYEIVNTVARGRVSYSDDKITFTGYEINPVIDEPIFAFPKPGQAELVLDTPISTLRSLSRAINAGDVAAALQCFSPQIAAELAALEHQSLNNLRRFNVLPDSVFDVVNSGARMWFWQNAFGQIDKMNFKKEKAGSDTMQQFRIEIEDNSKMKPGVYQFIKTENAWKIDTNPFTSESHPVDSHEEEQGNDE